jgi:hypothetical protein
MNLLKKISLILVGVFTTLTPDLFALDMEMHVIREFLPIRSALAVISLIFSDTSYNGIIFVMMAGSIAGGVLTTNVKTLVSGKASYGTWLLPMATGTVIYLSLILNTGRIILEDEVTGEIEAIPGVPNAIVAVLGTLNAVEYGLINIIDTAILDVEKRYVNGSGGIGFDMIKELTSKDLELPDRYMNQSVLAYVNNCFFLEMGQNATTLTLNSVNSNINFIAEYAKAANPAIFTTVYTEAVPSGTAMSCFAAWSGAGGLAVYLATTTNYNPIQRVLCEDAGFDMNEPLQQTACQNIVEQHVNIITDGAVTTTASTYLSQAYMANIISQAAREDDDTFSLTQATYKNQTKGLSLGLATADTVHMIKGIMTAIAIGLTSVLCFLLPTPLFPKVLSALFGLFLYTTIWGIMDCLVHTLTIEFAKDCFSEGSAFQMGYQSFFTAPTAAEKAIGIFGTMRSVSTVLAALITGMLVRQGGALMGRMVTQASVPMKDGALEIEKNQTIEGKGQKLGSLRSGASEMLVANRPQEGSFMNSVGSEASNKLENFAGGREKFSNLPETIAAQKFNVNKQRESALDLKNTAETMTPGEGPKTAAKLSYENMSLKTKGKEISGSNNSVDGHINRSSDAGAFQALTGIKGAENKQEILGKDAVNKQAKIDSKGTQAVAQTAKDGKMSVGQTVDKMVGKSSWDNRAGFFAAANQQSLTSNSAKDMAAHQTESLEQKSINADLGKTNIADQTTKMAKMGAKKQHMDYGSQQEKLSNATSVFGNDLKLDEYGGFVQNGQLNNRMSKMIQEQGYHPTFFNEASRFKNGIVDGKPISGEMNITKDNMDDVKKELTKQGASAKVLDNLKEGSVLQMTNIDKNGQGGSFKVQTGTELMDNQTSKNLSGTEDVKKDIETNQIERGLKMSPTTPQSLLQQNDADSAQIMGTAMVNDDGTMNEANVDEFVKNKAQQTKTYYSQNMSDEQIQSETNKWGTSYGASLNFDKIPGVKGHAGANVSYSNDEAKRHLESLSTDQIAAAYKSEIMGAYDSGVESADDIEKRNMLRNSKYKMPEDQKTETIRSSMGGELQYVSNKGQVEEPAVKEQPVEEEPKPQNDTTYEAYQKASSQKMWSKSPQKPEEETQVDNSTKPERSKTDPTQATWQKM